MSNLISTLDEKSIRQQLDALATQCEVVGPWLAQIGYPEPRIRERGFKTLAQAICGQQISVTAAKAIWQRLEDHLDGNIQSDTVGRLGEDTLRGLGFSKRKAEYILGLAQQINQGNLCFDALEAMDDTAAIKRLTELRGFGPWTAQIYLLFAEGRQDIWPHDDIALQESLRTLFKLQERPKGKDTISLIEHWRPYRSVGALFAWHVYGSTTLG